VPASLLSHEKALGRPKSVKTVEKAQRIHKITAMEIE